MIRSLRLRRFGEKMRKINEDASKGCKLLTLFKKLFSDGRKHYLADLASELECSKQTVGRLIMDIEGVFGTNLIQGLDGGKKWYQLATVSTRRCIPAELEELRYLALCREIAEPYLPEQAKARIDSSIFKFSMLLADQEENSLDKTEQQNFKFYPKGRIDYSPHMQTIEDLSLAIERKYICEIKYRTPGHDSRVHLFVPAKIAVLNGGLYALGATFHDDRKTQNYLTTLAVHRIESLTLTQNTVDYEFPPYSASEFGLPWHEPRTFSVIVEPSAAEYVRERIWADKQNITELEDGSIRLEITTRSEKELRAWVGGFLGKARIEE